MPEPAAAAARTGPGPSAPAAVPHGLRARAFGLLPEERAAEWAAHVAGVCAGLRPTDALEEQLATAFAAAQLAGDPRRPQPGGDHGRDRARGARPQPWQRLCRAAPRRRHGHRRALHGRRRHGHPARPAHVPRPPQGRARRAAARAGAGGGARSRQPEPRPRKRHVRTRRAIAPRANPRDTLAENDTCEPGTPTLGHAVGAAGAADGLDDAAWVAALPAVEADPEREARRKAALLQIEPRELIRAIGHAPLHDLEQYLVAGDPVAYEEWFARQPKPPRIPAKSLGPEDAALVDWVTRHNPPWLKGEYLSYWRPPVPAHLFLPGATDDTPPPVRRRPWPPRQRHSRRRPPTRCRACAPASTACSTAASSACPRSSTSPRRCARSSGPTGRPIAARSTSASCAWSWPSARSRPRPCTGWTATRSPRRAGREVDKAKSYLSIEPETIV